MSGGDESKAGLRSVSMRLDDRATAEEALAPFFPTMRLSGRDTSFRSRFAIASTARFTLAEYAFETPGFADAGADDYLVVESVGTGYEVEHGGSRFDLRHPYLAPQAGIAASWQSVHARVVSLDRQAVEQVARDLAGDPELRVRRPGTAPVSAQAARYWATTAKGLRQAVVSAPEAFDSPLIQQATFHRLAVALLHVFPDAVLKSSSYGVGAAVCGDAAAGVRGALVARAVEYLREHAGEPITVVEVARAMHVSVRGLHTAFVRALGEPPTAVLRGVRLEGARADLLDAPPGTSVTLVAQRWGFAHLPRFADAYRREYGELPSETLRR